MIAVYRVFKFAFQNFWRNFWLSIITVSMLVLTLLTVNILLVLNLVTEKAISFVEGRIEVSVYFESDTPEERIASAAEYLRGLRQVRDIETITAEEALVRFKDSHSTDAAILQSLDEVGGNPFGSTLVVRAHSADDFPFILDALDNPQFRDDIREKDFSNYETLIERIRTTTERIRLFGMALSAVFLVIAMLIVFNTVRMGIFMHREEIGIMKLVGASDWFVRAPFLIETIGYGLAATLIVAFLTIPLAAVAEDRLTVFFDGRSPEILLYFEEHWLIIFGLQFLALALVSAIATGVAMRKYLRV